jgi:hypothetical protein
MECLPSLSGNLQPGSSVWDLGLENEPSFILLRLKVDIERLKTQERHALNVLESKRIVKLIIEKLIENLRFLHKPICKSFPKEDRIRDIQRVEAEFRDYLRKRDEPGIRFSDRNIDLLYD